MAAWIKSNEQRHACACGCGGFIPIIRNHFSRGIPKFISRHHDANDTIAVRFWAKVVKGGEGECWLWSGLRNACGYGKIRFDGHRHFAHRLSFALHYGVTLSTEHVLHSCDNPACVNPAHLSLGTHAANMADMKKKGRQPKGGARYRMKLTDDAVRSIRSRHGGGVSVASLARGFGVSRWHISNIVAGKAWKHVTQPQAELQPDRAE